MPDIITTGQLAERLRVTPQTIRRWTQQGIIRPLRRIVLRPILYDWDQVRAALEPTTEKKRNH
jgi:predicted site-specific integrase-resolvase